MLQAVKDAMDNSSDLPKTFEEYQQMHPITSRKVPMSHIQKLRDEFDNKRREDEMSKPLKPINFDLK